MRRTGENQALALRRIGNARPRPATDPFRPGVWFEALEPRRLMTSVTLGADGILVVEGSEGVDDIAIYRRRTGEGPLVVNGRAYPLPGDVGPVRDIQGEFPLAAVRGIRVYGLGGDDRIRIMNCPDIGYSPWDRAATDDYGRLYIPVTLDGGAGDDELISQSEADDVLIGGTGNDRAYAIDGNDLFAVETVGDYRDATTYVDADREIRPIFGTFTWNGPEDQLFPDPYLVPTKMGSYTGPNAPDFTVTPDGGTSGTDGDSTDASTDGSGGSNDATDGSTGGSAVLPAALGEPLLASSPALASDSPTHHSDEDLWNDSPTDVW